MSSELLTLSANEKYDFFLRGWPRLRFEWLRHRSRGKNRWCTRVADGSGLRCFPSDPIVCGTDGGGGDRLDRRVLMLWDRVLAGPFLAEPEFVGPELQKERPASRNERAQDASSLPVSWARRPVPRIVSARLPRHFRGCRCGTSARAIAPGLPHARGDALSWPATPAPRVRIPPATRTRRPAECRMRPLCPISNREAYTSSGSGDSCVYSAPR